MNRILIIALILASPGIVWAGENVSAPLSVQAVQIQDTFAAKLSNKVQWAFVAEDVGTGKLIVDVGNSRDHALVPGSLIKLFVSGAVLERNALKPFDLSTVIAIDGKVKHGKLNGDIVIKGAGNALLSTNDLIAAIDKLKARGITDINGDVLVDDTLFDVNAWKSTYHGPAYGVPSTLGLDLHTVAVTADPASRKVVIDPVNESVKTSLNPSGKPGIRQIDDYTYEIIGVRRDSGTIHKRFALNDPALYAGGTFLTMLKQFGIKVKGTVKRGVHSEKAKEIVRINAGDINQTIAAMDKNSLNVIAENLLFLLGAENYGKPGTREKGTRAVKSFLAAQNIDINGMVLDVGSGVSDKTRVSAKAMTAFLKIAAGKPWFPAFTESLPIVGKEGTLKGFSYKSDRIHAKSGQLENAYGLAGYVEARSGRKIAFAYMVNGPGMEVSQTAASAVVDALKVLEMQ